MSDGREQIRPAGTFDQRLTHDLPPVVDGVGRAKMPSLPEPHQVIEVIKFAAGEKKGARFIDQVLRDAHNLAGVVDVSSVADQISAETAHVAQLAADREERARLSVSAGSVVS